MKILVFFFTILLYSSLYDSNTVVNSAQLFQRKLKTSNMSQGVNQGLIQEMPNTALIIVDMTNQYLDERYTGYVPNTQNLPEHINLIRNRLKSLIGENYLEVFTTDCLLSYTKCLLNKDEILISDQLIDREDFLNSKRIPIHPVINADYGETPEEELNALQKLIPNLFTSNMFILEKAFERPEYSAFGEDISGQNRYGHGKASSTLNRILQARNIKRVFVVGLAYQSCVLYTAADSAYLGYETYLVENASYSQVITRDECGKKIPDALLLDDQIYEANKVMNLIANRFNGLPPTGLKVVRFDGNNFITQGCLN